MDSQLYRRSDQALFAEVGKDVVALHVVNGQCFGMENVAAEVWNLLAEPTSVEQLCADLVDRYEVEPETCHREVVALLEQFEQEGLIQPA